MTIYKVVPMPAGAETGWGVQCIAVDGTITLIGPFGSEADAHDEAERMADLDGERSA